MGTTEEGQVDHVDKIVEMRDKWIKKGVNFYLHVDAAYGGYGRTVYRDEDNNFMPYEQLKDKFKEYGIFTENNQFLKKNVYNAYKAMGAADSVTDDPHKMGYVPYDAGGLTMKDSRLKNTLTYYAPYAFEEGIEVPASIGQFTLEGSKSVGSAAAVWVANKILPLNISGYGRLVARTLYGARRLHDLFDGQKFEVDGHTIISHVVYDPDFNMVDWVYQEEGNNSLQDMNNLTQAVMEYASTAKGGKLYNIDLQLSDTSFEAKTYGDAPVKFIESLGMSADEYHQIGKLEVLRSSCMSPWMHNSESFDYWANIITRAIQEKLEEVAKNEDIL